MKVIKKQEGYMLMVHHEDTMMSALLWFFFRKNKHCRKFCPTCKWYFRCQEDVALEKMLEE